MDDDEDTPTSSVSSSQAMLPTSRSDSSLPETQKLGFTACLSYVIGTMIGSGIFITPSSVIEQAGSAGMALGMWLAGAIVSFAGAFVYIELGTSVPKSGAEFTYALFVGWDSIAFSFMVVQCLSSPAYGALLVVTLGDYAVGAISTLAGTLDATMAYWLSRFIGCTALAFLAAINCYSVGKVTARLQIAVTGAKVLSLVVVVAIGLFVLIFRDGATHFNRPFDGSHLQPGSMVLSAYAALWCYGGYDVLNFGLREVKKPRRNLPLSMLLGLSIVCVCYMLVNIAILSVLTVDEMKGSKALILDFISKSVSPHLSWLISLVITVFLIGTINSSLFSISRYIEAAANEGHLPHIFGAINKETGSPRVAVVAIALMSAVCSVVDVATLISSVSFVGWAQKLIGAAALLMIRWKKIPVHEDAIKFPIVFALAFLAVAITLLAIPILTEFQVAIFGLILLVCSFSLYFLIVRQGRSAECLVPLKDCIERVIKQVLLVEIIKEKQSSHGSIEPLDETCQ